jgi:DNA-binding NarL/FixJ family response regulator
MTTIRTLISDDSSAMRRALIAVLDGYEGIHVIGEASDGQEAIEQARALCPDLVIMDISMPRVDGLAAAREIKELFPETEILIFSMHRVKEYVEYARQVGMSGFVVKEEGGTELLSAVNDVIHHQPHFPVWENPETGSQRNVFRTQHSLDANHRKN